jgi:hypothetical protein
VANDSRHEGSILLSYLVQLCKANILHILSYYLLVIPGSYQAAHCLTLLRGFTFFIKQWNMKLMKLIMGFFVKSKSHQSPFSEAVSEAFKETFKEMGYRFEDNDNSI